MRDFYYNTTTISSVHSPVNITAGTRLCQRLLTRSELVPSLLFDPAIVLPPDMSRFIGDPGAVSGGGDKSKRAKKSSDFLRPY